MSRARTLLSLGLFIVFMIVLSLLPPAPSATAQDHCGDGTCNFGEDCHTCPADCGACVVCGDGICVPGDDPGEDCNNCPEDCGACGPVCGNGACETGENHDTCSVDCPVGTADDVDGDGVPNDQDACPYVSGYGEQYGGVSGADGCPADSDADGINDGLDTCPFVAGPDWNKGCPVDQPGPEVIEVPNPEPVEAPVVVAPLAVLPGLPLDGLCSIATQSDTPVNLRAGPSTSENVVGAMSFIQVYTAVAQAQDEQSRPWYQLESGGWAAGWVTRQDDECSSLSGLLPVSLMDSPVIADLTLAVEPCLPEPSDDELLTVSTRMFSFGIQSQDMQALGSDACDTVASVHSFDTLSPDQQLLYMRLIACGVGPTTALNIALSGFGDLSPEELLNTPNPCSALSPLAPPAYAMAADTSVNCPAGEASASYVPSTMSDCPHLAGCLERYPHTDIFLPHLYHIIKDGWVTNGDSCAEAADYLDDQWPTYVHSSISYCTSGTGGSSPDPVMTMNDGSTLTNSSSWQDKVLVFDQNPQTPGFDICDGIPEPPGECPAAPTLVTPLEAAVVSTTSPILRWEYNGGCLPDGYAVEILPYVDPENMDEEDWEDYSAPATWLPHPNSSWIVSPPLLNCKTYQWVVYAEKDGGDIVPSEFRTFAVDAGGCDDTQGDGPGDEYADVDHVTQPELVEPPNGAADVETNPTFEWTYDSPSSTSDGYTVQLSLVQDFNPLWTPPTAFPTANSWYTTGLLPHTTYFWRVAAKFTNDIGAWSETGVFTTGSGTPQSGDCVLIEPLGITAAPAGANATEITWSYDGNCEPENYIFQVSHDDPSFSTYDTQGVSDDASLLFGNYGEACDTYYVRVRAERAGALGPWSDIGYKPAFEGYGCADSDEAAWCLLSPPTLTSPGDNGSSLSRVLVFNWLPYEGCEPDNYIVEMGFDPSSMWTNAWVPGEHSGYVAPNLAACTEYYWRVKAQVDGVSGPWSEMRSFTTMGCDASEPDVAPVAHWPSGAIGTTTPMFEWEYSLNPESYTVFVYQNGGSLIITGTPHEGPYSSFSLNTPLENCAVYSWWVEAWDDGPSAPSNVLTFTVETADCYNAP